MRFLKIVLIGFLALFISLHVYYYFFRWYDFYPHPLLVLGLILQFSIFLIFIVLIYFYNNKNAERNVAISMIVIVTFMVAQSRYDFERRISNISLNKGKVVATFSHIERQKGPDDIIYRFRFLGKVYFAQCEINEVKPTKGDSALVHFSMKYPRCNRVVKMYE